MFKSLKFQLIQFKLLKANSHYIIIMYQTIETYSIIFYMLRKKNAKPPSETRDDIKKNREIFVALTLVCVHVDRTIDSDPRPAI